MAQLMWVLDHLDDVASDMSVFHRVGDIWSMPGRAFFRLAWRLPLYAGAMCQRVGAAQQSEPRPAPSPAAPQAAPRQVNPGMKASIQADPVLAGLISFG